MLRLLLFHPQGAGLRAVCFGRRSARLDRLGSPESRLNAGRYPSDLSDARWELVEPVLTVWPSGRRGRGLDIGQPPDHDLRSLLDAVLYVNRSGIPWRYLSHDYPHWNTSTPTSPVGRKKTSATSSTSSCDAKSAGSRAARRNRPPASSTPRASEPPPTCPAASRASTPVRDRRTQAEHRHRHRRTPPRGRGHRHERAGLDRRPAHHRPSRRPREPTQVRTPATLTQHRRPSRRSIWGARACTPTSWHRYAAATTGPWAALACCMAVSLRMKSTARTAPAMSITSPTSIVVAASRTAPGLSARL